MEFKEKFKEKVKSSDEIMDLAKEFKVSYHTMERWLKLGKCKRMTELDNVLKLCVFYNTTIGEIFHFSYE
ncbi:MAG: DNA-binding Xre family transcriptional regulator [Vicingaceae bacterium]|jgi:DNA-binding Xre family transcriptional regulator